MSVNPPPPEPAVEEGSAPSSAVRRSWLERFGARTLLGLLVLAAIVGGLVAFDRLGGSSELGPLDDRRPEEGEPAPLFALRDPDGGVQRLDDFRGRVVWINFWATWCGPCRRELPAMQRLSDEFGDQGLTILAVNFRESAEQALAFWEELGVELPILLDSDGEVARQYRLFGFPDHFFIDREGVVRSLELGDLTEEEMRERLAELGLGS